MRGAVFVALLTVFVALGAAAEPAPRWEELSDRERAQAWQNFEEYRQLPEDRRRFIERRYDRYRDLPPGEQKKLRRNYNRYQGLDAQERDRFHRKYRRWKSKRKAPPPKARPSKKR